MPKVLFLAPLDFDREVWAEYQAIGAGLPDDGIRMVRWDVDAIVCSPGHPAFVDDNMLMSYPNLRLLATASTGTNHIDLEACAARGIKVLSLLDDRDGLNTISASAEWTFKLILEGLRLKKPYHELRGRTVGLVGYGRIGHKVGKWLSDFGAGWLVHDPYLAPGYSSALESIFYKEVVVICCALTDETRGMITYDLLRRLPPDAVLVNTARGEVINEADLCRFMAARPDVRVCLDVVTGEVDGTANPERLRQLGAYVTPHIAGETFESRTKAARIILGLLKKEMVTA